MLIAALGQYCSRAAFRYHRELGMVPMERVSAAQGLPFEIADRVRTDEENSGDQTTKAWLVGRDELYVSLCVSAPP